MRSVPVPLTDARSEGRSDLVLTEALAAVVSPPVTHLRAWRFEGEARLKGIGSGVGLRQLVCGREKT